MKEKLDRVIQRFIEYGFKKHKTTRFNEHASCLLQKDIRDENGKLKFYINVYPYIVDQIKMVKVSCEVQMYKDDLTFDLAVYCVEAPEIAIYWCNKFWENMNMDYDHNND